VVATRTQTEAKVVEALAPVLGLVPEEVSVDSDLLHDLGTNSLLLARFRARLRRDPDLPPLSAREVYEHSRIEELAGLLETSRPPAPAGSTDVAAAEPPARVSTLRYLLCGAAQLLSVGTYLYLLTLAFTPGFDWIAAAQNLPATYLRSLVVGVGFFAVLCLAPIALKWLLVGRWKTTEIPLWGPRYLRFWFVRTLIRSNPLMAFVGSPLYTLYLRALGARIGRGTLVLTKHLPTCTDLLTVGAHSVIRKDVWLNCYRAEIGRIRTGRVILGERAVVGEGSVVDIDTAVGEDGQLGHSSALHRGGHIPAGTRWHGSPAEPTTVDYLGVPPARVTRARKAVHAVSRLLPLLVVYLPISLGLLDDSVLEGRWTFETALPDQWAFYAVALEVSAVLFFGALPLGLLLVLVVPRLFRAVLRPGRVYPLYGMHYAALRLIHRLTNATFFMHLFGDSAYIVHWLGALGYRLRPVEQTGSNFGTAQQHEVPHLASVGTGTMVSDGLSMINVNYSSTSFRLERAVIGEHNFLGNSVRYPAGGRTGANCLLATKVLVPLDGEVHENVGLLGAPAFTIPRTVQRDADVVQPQGPVAMRRAVAGKTRHNTGTLLLFLAACAVYCFGALLVGLLDDYLPTPPAITATATELAEILLTLGYFGLLERASLGFRRLRPRTCSIYDRAFWRHERYWKFMAPFLAVLDGTPLKPVALRLLGVRVGRQVFDDGCQVVEKTLTTIGDGCVLNAGSVLQAHSLEDGAFKSDHITLESGVTLGVGAFVHYGASIGRAATVDADSFLMKGEEIGPQQYWCGNPAHEVTSPTHGSTVELVGALG
jgi:non-ribosomal peptide synthetase-like protein